MHPRLLLLAACAVSAFAADAPQRKILFFTKSSGFEHDVISYKKGMPSFAEKQLLELGTENKWEFVFSKDGSKFSPQYLAQFDTVMFYTTGDLCSEGTDKNPPMSMAGKQALFDYVRSGKGFVGTHSAADTFHTDNEAVKGPERFTNHGDKADAYVCFLGAEFIRHGKQQEGRNQVIDPTFPGFEKVGAEFTFAEEWYTLKDFRPEIHVLTVFNNPALEGDDYKRPAYPNTWARNEGKGRVFYTAMGHREDVWTNPTFRQILVGGVKWALGDAKAADLSPNLLKVAPGAMTNQPYTATPAPKAKAPAKKADAKK
ncbi:MAG: ThuA domain-containing protein [Verrucomicrobiota bacterium]